MTKFTFLLTLVFPIGIFFSENVSREFSGGFFVNSQAKKIFNKKKSIKKKNFSDQGTKAPLYLTYFQKNQSTL
jgi:hypothetical protein